MMLEVALRMCASFEKTSEGTLHMSNYYSTNFPFDVVM